MVKPVEAQWRLNETNVYQIIEFSMWMRLLAQRSIVVVVTSHISYRKSLYFFFPVAWSFRNQLLLRNSKPCRTRGERCIITCPIAPRPVLVLAATRDTSCCGIHWIELTGGTSQDDLFLSSSHLSCHRWLVVLASLDSQHILELLCVSRLAAGAWSWIGLLISTACHASPDSN